MGFLDKAKKLADQAQAKIDEAQGQFNQRPVGGSTSGPVVEYDSAGRPIRRDEDVSAAEAGAAAPVPPAPPVSPAAAEAPAAPPAAPAPPASGEVPEATPRDDEKPPTFSSGDPLGG